MKISELRKQLAALAAVMEGLEVRPERVEALNQLVSGLRPFNSRNVSEMKLGPIAQATAPIGFRLSEIAKALDAVNGFVKRVGKASTVEAFNDLRISMNDRQEMTIRSFIDSLHEVFSPDRPKATPDEPLTDAYIKALEAAKHDANKFPRVFEHLSDDERLDKDALNEIANRFAFKMAKSSRKAALERIWKMHNASESFAAKSRAMKGKSAA